MMKKALFYFLMLFPLLCLTACSKDDNDSSNDEKDTPQNDEIAVVIGEDGKTSNGSLYVPIDDKSFYLDYIKYSVEESHLAVTGHDKTGLKKDAQIVSKITWKGSTYTVCTIKSRAFYDCKELLSITIPNSVTRIDTLSFYNCLSLRSVELPHNLTTIGSAAFEGCDALSCIIIPKSVTSIGDAAFSWCMSIVSIVVEDGNSIYDSREQCNAIIESKSGKMIAACQNTTFPQSVNAIGRYAFQGCQRLVSITIPNTIRSIGDHAFTYCSSLVDISLPNTITKIDDHTFHGCGQLTEIAIPNSVRSIGERAFYLCKSLTSLTIPSKITSIGNNAFLACIKLNEIHSEIVFPFVIDASVFDSKNYYNATLYVPSNSLSRYKNTASWSEFQNIVGE